MKSKDATGSVRVKQARGRWSKHLVAQRASGQTQTAYCRAQGLDPSYFSMWKRRLAARGAVESAPVSSSMRLAPLMLKKVPELDHYPEPITESISMRVTLRNGLSVALTIPRVKSVPGLLNELAQLPC